MNEGIKKFGKRIINNIIGVFVFQLLFLFMGWAGVTASNFVMGWVAGVFIWTSLDYLVESISRIFDNQKES